MSGTLEYPYKAKLWAMLGAIAFFGACAALMARAAVTNDRGLVLNGVIELSVQGATIFYWCLAAVSALFVLAGAMALVAGLTHPRFVRLTATELSAPKNGFSKQTTVIPLRNIEHVGIQAVHRQRFISIHHTYGTLNLAQSMLPSAAAFAALHSALAARVGRR